VHCAFRAAKGLLRERVAAARNGQKNTIIRELVGFRLR
jgi:hypothetical protein